MMAFNSLKALAAEFEKAGSEAEPLELDLTNQQSDPKSASMRLKRSHLPSSSPRISTSNEIWFGLPYSRHKPWATLCSVFGAFE
jgi:hypothetical protein